jgi:hypothetical protein
MTTNKAEIVITAMDRVTAVIDRISERMERLGKASNISNALARFSNSAGVERVNGALGNASANIAKIATISGVAAGAAGFAFSKAVNRIDDFADSMANAGIAGKDLVEASAMRDFMGQFGVGSEDASSAMIKLTKSMSAARAGAAEQQDAFAAAGITMADLKKKSPVEVMKKMMDAFSHSDRAGAKLAVLSTLAGKSSTKMAAAFSQGTVALEEYKKKFKDALLTEKDFDSGGNAADALTRIWEMVSRVTDKVSAAISPKLQGFLDRAESGILNLLPKIVSRFNEFFDSIDEDRVMKFFDDVGEVFSRIGAVFRWLNENTSATTKIVAVLGLAFAPTIAALFTISTVALPLVSAAFQRLGAVVMANPILATVSAIAAGVYLIYENWDAVYGYFSGVFARIKGVFDVGFFDGVIQVWLESWQGMANGIIAILQRIPLIKDLDIVKNINLISLASERAEALIYKNPLGSYGAVEDARLARSGPKPEQSSGWQGTGMFPQMMRGQSAAQIVSGRGAAQKVDFAGRMKIEVSDTRVKVSELSSSNRSLPIDVMVNAGLYGTGA